MQKCEQPNIQGSPASRQPPPAPDSRGNQGRGILMPVVKRNLRDDWWARHWVGGKLPLGRGLPASDPSHNTGRRTYSTATSEGRGSEEAERAKVEARLALLPADILTFLNRFKKDDENCAFYPSKISWLQQRGHPKLAVNFKHLLQDKRDWDLACTVCNYQQMSHSYVKRAAIDFFNLNGFNAAQPEIKFKNMPRRIFKAEHFLLSSARAQLVLLFNGHTKIRMATTHGRRACDAILCGVLDYLRKGVSWGGELKLDDILVIEDADGCLKLMITRIQVIEENASGAARLDDLLTIWASLEPHYILDGKLPLYFEELKRDIERATSIEMKSGWFYTYLYFHPALYSSLARGNFICRLQQDYKCLELRSIKEYSIVFSEEPPMSDEWILTANNCNHFKSVYDHPLKKAKKNRISPHEDSTMDKHENNLGGLLEFCRNSVQHINENATISNLDENELFTANSFSGFLPFLIRKLLEARLLNGAFSSAWSNYMASKSDQRGPPGSEVAGTWPREQPC